MTSNFGIVKPSLCPHCGELLDCATGMENEEHKPVPGDFSLCISCGTMLRFTDDLSLRLMSADEISELAEDQREMVEQAKIARQKVIGDRASDRWERN